MSLLRDSRERALERADDNGIISVKVAERSEGCST